MVEDLQDPLTGDTERHYLHSALLHAGDVELDRERDGLPRRMPCDRTPYSSNAVPIFWRKAWQTSNSSGMTWKTARTA
jgi:hypothetical protein